MISLDEAKQIISACQTVKEAQEEIALKDSVRRILSTDIHAPYDSPAFDNSAMDGFAFHTNDLLNKSHARIPTVIAGEVAAGNAPVVLPRPNALRIFTGAPIPHGANCVVPVEHCTVTEGNRVLIKEELLNTIRENQHIRPKGLNFAKEELVLKRGTVLGSMNTAVLASQGISRVPVYKKIRITIGVTGDELASGTEPLRPGAIYDSNSTLLTSLCANLGFDIVVAQNIPDTAEDTARFLKDAALDTDAILTSGGISMGDKDYIKILLANPMHRGIEKCRIHFQNLALKPGKPFTFASIGDTPLFCMPGNPLSVFITFLYLVLPYLQRLAGKADDDKGHGGVRLECVTSPCDFSPHPRTRFLLTRKGDGTSFPPEIELLPEQSSAAIEVLRNTDGAIIIPANTVVAQGSYLQFFAFNQFAIL